MPRYNFSAFHERVRSAPGLRRVEDQYSYPYNVEETRMNTDPFVRKAMKLWDKHTYDNLGGYSKRGTLEHAMETFARYARPMRKRREMPSAVREAYDKAYALAKHTFVPREPLHRVSVPNACDIMNLDSAAGFSFPNRRKSECVQEAYDVASYMAHMISARKRVYVPPTKLAVRGHLHDIDEPKARPVWVYPFEVLILEAKWAIPYYGFLENEVDAVHFGEGSMIRLAKQLMSGLAGHDDAVEVTLDWSGFDASVPNFLIDDAFSILASAFDEEYTCHDGKLVFGGEKMRKKNKAVLDWLIRYFKYTKVMLPDGSVYTKSHGIPSGSFFTQAIGTIVNFLCVRTLDFFFQWGGKRFKFLGDDSSFLVPFGKPKVQPFKIAEVAKEAFGLTLKPEKLRVAARQHERKFLGYQMQGYRYVRDSKEWLLLALHAERDVEYLEQSASRVVAYYLLGGCNDDVYCSFFRDYLRRYPQIRGRPLEVTSGIKRLFKFVLRTDLSFVEVPDLDKLDLLKAPFCLSLGDRPFD